MAGSVTGAAGSCGLECGVCEVEKQVETCGHCPDYECATLAGFLAMAPMLREKLERIRSAHLGRGAR